MYKKSLIRIAIAFAIAFGAYHLLDSNKNQTLPVIAITQIIDHNTLDVVREGLIEGLAKEGYVDGKTIQIVYENAHGNIAVATQIGQRFASLKPVILVGLSTQSAQILQPHAQALSVPLVFSAVTDPISAKLVSSWKKTDGGVTGISDYMNAQPQLAMIKQFIPQLKRLGVLYNPSEVNSVSFLETFEKVATEMGITIVRAALNTTSEAATAMTSLVGQVDAAYFPNDNTAMAAVGAIVTVGLKNNIPVFANDLASVQQGALAALAYDRREMGLKTAEIVCEILKGAPLPPVHNSIRTEIVMNGQTLEALGIEKPTDSSIRDVRS